MLIRRFRVQKRSRLMMWSEEWLFLPWKQRRSEMSALRGRSLGPMALGSVQSVREASMTEGFGPKPKCPALTEEVSLPLSLSLVMNVLLPQKLECLWSQYLSFFSNYPEYQLEHRLVVRHPHRCRMNGQTHSLTGRQSFSPGLRLAVSRQASSW